MKINKASRKPADAEKKEWLFGQVVAIYCGDITIITVFGKHIYKRVGSVKWLLGYVWGDNQ